jgi:hypothetical protein
LQGQAGPHQFDSFTTAGPYVSGHLVLEAFFGSSLLGVHNFVGWMAILATILNSLPVSLTILFVVRFRAM